MRTLKEVRIGEDVSLAKLTGKKIVDITGYMNDEFDPNMKLCAIVFEDGEKVYLGGEHDHVYIDCDIPGTTPEELKALYEEQNKE